VNPRQTALFHLWLAQLRFSALFAISHIENTYNQVQEAHRGEA
jgi:hypothetical protein